MHDKKVGFADPKTRRQIAEVALPNGPISCTLSHDGKQAFASAEEQNTVYVVSVADRKLVGEIRTADGSGPDPVLSVPAR